jgi:hypothetical protein
MNFKQFVIFSDVYPSFQFILFQMDNLKYLNMILAQ